MSGYWRLDLFFLSFISGSYVGSGTVYKESGFFYIYVRDSEKECDQRTWRTDSW